MFDIFIHDTYFHVNPIAIGIAVAVLAFAAWLAARGFSNRRDR
jgi:hypothetical protein